MIICPQLYMKCYIVMLQYVLVSACTVHVHFPYCVCICVCPQQEWLSQSWCCWLVWTHAPTRGSTQRSPAVCPESCWICCTVGQELAAGAPCLTTPPRHTPPPPRTACTDRDWWDRNKQRDMFEKTCNGAHRPDGRTCDYTELCHHQPKRRSLTTQHADLHQMLSTTRGSCAVNRSSICNHRSFLPQQRGIVSLKTSTPFYEGM